MTSCIRTIDRNSDNRNHISAPGKDLLLHIPLDKGKFKYADLKEFIIDTIGWDKRNNIYNKIDSISFYKIYQNTSLEYIGQFEEAGDFDFFYSTQNNNRGLVELTVLSQREGTYCDMINYLIYDKRGKLLSSFRVAGRCADGGFYEIAYGNFINDSTYVLFSEDNYDTKNVDKDNIISYSKQTTIINRNGKLTQRDTTIRQETKPNR
jgi:hypothetical protein